MGNIKLLRDVISGQKGFELQLTNCLVDSTFYDGEQLLFDQGSKHLSVDAFKELGEGVLKFLVEPPRSLLLLGISLLLFSILFVFVVHFTSQANLYEVNHVGDTS